MDGEGLDYLTPVVETTAILRKSPGNEHALRRRDEMVRRAVRVHPLSKVADAAELSPRATAEIIVSGRSTPAPPERTRAQRLHTFASAPVAGRLLGAARRVALAVGVGAGAGQRAAVDDQVLLADRAARRTSTRGSRACRPRSGPGPRGWCRRCAGSCRGGASSARGGRCGAGWGNQTSPA